MKFRKILGGLTSLAMSLSVVAGVSTTLPPNTLTANAAQTDWKFDFGGKGAAGGYTGVSATDGYNSGRGYGFAQTNSVSNVNAGGSGALSDAVKFNSGDAKNTFNVDLPKGLYEVKVITGNSPRTTIKLEGMLQMMNLTGNNAVETVQIPVTDGQLNVQAVAGMNNREYSIAAMEIKQLNTTGEMKPTIWICGDSTVANYYNTADTAQHGWGQLLGNYVDTKTYQIRNMAASGQFAKGFVDAGQFTPIETYGKSGDIYIISIGINDTNYSNATEYYNTVTDMVKKAKAKGMTVYLVKQQGRRGDLQRSPLLGGRWFGGELDKIGSEQNVTVFDLFNKWQDFGKTVGYDGMASYYAIQANGSNDDLHQSKKGADKLAQMMAEFLKDGGNVAPKEIFVPEAGVSFMIKNVNSGLYMEVADGKASQGANVQQWGADKPADHNTWTFTQATGDYYYINSNLDGGNKWYLYVDEGSRVNGGNIVIAEKNGYSDQFFKFEENDDGTLNILTRSSRDACAVEVGSAKKNNGANIQQWEVNGHDCQKWVLEKVDAPAVTTTTTTSTTTTTTTTSAVTTTTVTETTAKPTTTAEPVTKGEPVLVKDPGDANYDGSVNLADAVLIMQSIANPDRYGLGRDGGITEQGYINADVTGDNDGVTVMDAQFIQRYCLGLAQLPEKVYDVPTIPETTTETTTTVTTTETTTTTTETTTEPITTVSPYIFAIDQKWDQGVKESTNAGFTNPDGYLNLDNVMGSYVDFSVNVPQDGNYMTHIRFANGSANDRKMKVYVNGDTNNYWMQSFTSTGAWTEWTEFGLVLPLKSGANTIRFESATSEGGPNFDYITLTLTDEPYAETYDPSQGQQQGTSDKPVVYLAGDSTVQTYRAQYAPQQGWGYYLQSYFTDNVTVVNNSIAGRSSKKFYDEGRYQSIVDNLKTGDFVMIQFAINDAGKANADRYAPVCGNVNNPSSGSYEWYMTQFINDTKAKGATPILVTTTIGMKAYSNGRFVNSYTDYCDACKKLSSKYSIPCIDLNSLMVSHYNSVGYDTAKSYHLMGAVAGSTDGTHFCEKGAEIVAGLVAKDVKSQNISGLAQYVK